MIKILCNASYLECAWEFFTSPENLFDSKIGRLLRNKIYLKLNLQAFQYVSEQLKMLYESMWHK